MSERGGDRRAVGYDDLIGLWQDGQRRLAVAEPADRVAMDRVVDELVDHLRRRLGGPFTVNELARLYVEQGTDWCFDVAVRVAPNRPAAWDPDHRGGRGVCDLRPPGDRLHDRTSDRREPVGAAAVLSPRGPR